jgi:hypothetical protein
MTALPPKAEINKGRLECLLCANSGHWPFWNNNRNVAHRDAGGGAVHSITRRRERVWRERRLGLFEQLWWFQLSEELACSQQLASHNFAHLRYRDKWKL